jgi:aldehyde dehydrogenase (NAD+)
VSVLEAYRTMTYGKAPEAADAATAWLARHGRRFGHFIGGRFVDPQGGDYFPSTDPATSRQLAEVAQGNEADVGAAVEAARAALAGWQALGGHGRARWLYAIARHLQKNSRLFAVLETLDNGKPIRETRDLDVPLAARHFYHHAGWAQLQAEELPGYSPVGVIGQIIPWNFPLLMLAWKIAPALAMGNTVVLKPAEFTPLTALLFADLCREIGLPAGVVNIVNGDGATGAHLVDHPGVDKIAFTGSTEVGRILRQRTAGTGKKLSLELGGKSPFLIFDDADLDGAVEGVVDAIWFNQGQVCCAGSRLLVHEGIFDKTVKKLKARMEKLRVGDPLDKAVDIGAIVAPVQLQRIESLVRKGVEEGSQLWQPSWSCPKEGCFYPPTLFTNVAPASTLAQVEIFGPVLVAMSFRTPEEAVALANNTRYGLAASVWTENVNLALDIAPQLQAGVVWINCTNHFDAAAGFGGYRESGFGREGGREGLYEYVKADWQPLAGAEPDAALPAAPEDGDEAPAANGGLPPVDRTAKLYIGGKQARPDGGYSYPVYGAGGRLVGEAGLANRKDVRDAVEAARKAEGWSKSTAHLRAQVLYFLAENLDARAREFAVRLAEQTGESAESAEREVAKSVERLFTWAAWADKYDGQVHATPFRNVTLAMNEPWGVLAIACPEANPLLGLVSLVGPALACGNRVIAVPSTRFPFSATDFYQVIDTSDVPGGALNLLTGNREELSKTLAQHDDVAAMWYFGSAAGSKMVEKESVGNLKATWVSHGKRRDFFDDRQSQGREFLRHATQVKNIWVPYGE